MMTKVADPARLPMMPTSRTMAVTKKLGRPCDAGFDDSFYKTSLLRNTDAQHGYQSYAKGAEGYKILDHGL